MSIPNFKSNHDWEAFTQIFDSQWHCKRALLNRVKDDLFPNTSWNGLTSGHMEVINDIVSNLVYECERQFKETHQDYKTDDDDTLPKEFLEHLQQMVEDIESGKEKVYPMDEDFMNRLKDLTKDVELEGKE